MFQDLQLDATTTAPVQHMIHYSLKPSASKRAYIKGLRSHGTDRIHVFTLLSYLHLLMLLVSKDIFPVRLLVTFSPYFINTCLNSRTVDERTNN